MFIEKILDVSNELVEAIERLVPELGLHKASPAREELTSLIKSESSTLWVARYPDENGIIAGMLTIAVYQVPTGMRSIIEDVVVDPNFRRRGIAEALLRSAIDFAREAGVNGVALTSNPQREAANKLYQSMGFERRETNSYIFRIK
ncbi:MAG: GNAT family N-acetyltransferase [Chloroflexota bacterium]